MTTSSFDPVRVRQSIYAILITVAVAAVAGRILSVVRVYEPFMYRDENHPKDTRGQWWRTRPEPSATHGDNDRSRWDTVRALVDQGTYVIGHREYEAAGQYHDTGIMMEDGWRTIDKVLRPEVRVSPSGKRAQEFYSSKPPFLATLVAGEYWLLKRTLGWSIMEERFQVVRTILMTINCLPLLVYLLLLARLVERLGTTDWGRLFVLATACFGTLLIPFEITLNNHTVAACTALFALYPALRILLDGERKAWLFAVAGFFAGFTACTELPAASFAVILFMLLLWRAPGRTLLLYLPALAIPAAVFLFTNHLAIGQWTPAYGEFGGPWYEYEGSHWVKPTLGNTKAGIDWAALTEGKGTYAFHFFLGHHGLFSLSPVFLLSAVGVFVFLLGKSRGSSPPHPQPLSPEYGGAGGMRAAGKGVNVGGETFPSPPYSGERGRGEGAISDSGSPQPTSKDYRILGTLTLLVSLIVVGFYLFKTSNYGGWAVGLRWLMWLTPFWLLTMLPVADWLSTRRWGRGLAYVCLAVSVFSANYPLNPWRNPWLYNFMESQGWTGY
ncbi:MAG TPA: hypothetical protein VK395_03740 [Gemmataceae bacterium]|nr:hypothetical protein [Gemmataceae bacterium]